MLLLFTFLNLDSGEVPGGPGDPGGDDPMVEVFKSTANGDPVPIMRIYMTAGATYRSVWTFNELDDQLSPADPFDFTEWVPGQFKLELAANENATPVVTVTSGITKQSPEDAGQLQVVIPEGDTKALQTANLKAPVGFIEGVDSAGDTRPLAYIQGSVTFTPN